MSAFPVDKRENNHNIGCQVLVMVAVLVTALPPSTAYIDCRISCRRCHENTEHPSVLEVYCAMCEECKQRRRERMRGGVGGNAEALAKTVLLGQQAAGDPSEHLQHAGPLPPSERPIPPGQPGLRGSPGPLNQHLRPGQQGHHAYSGKQGRPGKPGQSLLPVFMQQQPQLHPVTHQDSGSEPQKTAHKVSRPAQRGYEDYDMDRPMPMPAIPAGCPTPPVCSDTEEEPEILVQYSSKRTTTTTTRATTPQCPPITVCRKKRKYRQECMPCLPMCPCPGYGPTTPTTTHVDYQYLYIGLPKNMLQSR